ncbi:GTPase [Epidermidibacterium keratini]|uniref:GTPase n=1 Tax=Epidermidibacterium keratini TaxID=1891644 RepID=A0A7L4YLU3_9ACTN|nr:dynamin family protein [Epidermidibacterium keratini]QHC00241.1 GTPase [Epidermidibacterium keratini]
MPPTAQRMSPLVISLAQTLRPQVPPPTQAEIDRIIARLQGPLQLAVAGRIKSGKSTVVNALIGSRVSPTDIRECTRMVTRFQYGTVDRVEIRKKDGTTITLPFDDSGMIPSDLRCEPVEVAVVDVYLTYESLRGVTIVDTPGLASLDTESVGRTQEMLGADNEHTGTEGATDEQSQLAVSSAEAVLYVITQSIRADDADALQAFRRSSSGETSSPINALAILNKADQVTADEPMEAAAELAQEHSFTLRHTVSQVLPLIGLVAESSLTGNFTEADAQALRDIAALDEPVQQMMFMSTDFFLRDEVPVDLAARERLLTRLDILGTRKAVEMIRNDPQISTGTLRGRLESLSGFPQMRHIIDGVFSVRADDIKSSVALAALDTLASKSPPSVRDAIYDALEELYQQPEAQQLRLLEAASLVTSGKVELPDDMFDEVRDLVTGTSPGEMLGDPAAPVPTLTERALEAAGRWRTFATFGSTPAQSRIAHTIHRSYFLLWQELRAHTAGGAQ